jgi:hypothetical protein
MAPQGSPERVIGRAAGKAPQSAAQFLHNPAALQQDDDPQAFEECLGNRID